MKTITCVVAVLFLLSGCLQPQGNVEKTEITELQNPILPGYFADPSLVQYDGKFYLYATADPWGTDFLSCWVSDDFRNWTFHKLNWPTKEECTSPLSGGSKVWAPSVIQKDDMFYMYISVGSEVWCGKASHPLGPWENALGNQPMIPFDKSRYYHVIDAEAFIDDDGRAYLYWGSGWNWTNGHCFAAELAEDMSSFKTEPVEVTPTNYFEGPLMVKHEGVYYLTYSEGKTMDETYEVRYAVGDTPFGPFVESTNSPVLSVNDSLLVYGPGHHTTFIYQDKNYILYHRHRLPFVTGTAFRQICINEFMYNDDKREIETVIPYSTQSFPVVGKENKQYIVPEKVEASSTESEFFMAHNLLDGSYATRWEAAKADENPALTVFFKESVGIDMMEVRFEYAWEKYFIKVDVSADGDSWQTVADFSKEGVEGSPVDIPINTTCKQLKISFRPLSEGVKPSLWDLRFY